MIVGALLAVTGGLLGAGPVAHAAAGEPILPIGGQLFDPSPPGSNDWDCRPGSRHPDPVVLVHGLTANQSVNWGYLAPILSREGYCVFSLTYGRSPFAPPPLSQIGGLQRMEHSAHELGRFIDRVRRATHADKVDIVGHSEGSLMPNYYVKFLGGDRYVHRYIGMTPLWRGTTLYGVAELNRLAGQFGLSPVLGTALAPLCASCREFLHGSPFLRKMSSGGGPAVPGVTYTMIMTSHDELVKPYTSGRLDERNGAKVTNIVLQDHCPSDLAEHAAVAFDPVNAQYVLNALDPARARPVRCTSVGPDAPTARHH
jgi:pimeloyl-ACP methyl ester carboxylesterase